MKLTIPDYMSLSRIPLAIIFFVFINDIIISFLLLLLIILTDILDGYLARKLNQTTKYGGALDPLADKFFIIGAFLAYVFVGKLFVWQFFLVIIRDIYSLTEIVLMNLIKHAKTHKANAWGKITTTLQFFLIAALIFDATSFYEPLIALIIISSIATIYSYIRLRWLK